MILKLGYSVNKYLFIPFTHLDNLGKLIITHLKRLPILSAVNLFKLVTLAVKNSGTRQDEFNLFVETT